MSVGNTLAMAVLRSPLHRTMSRSLLVLDYRGRRTGKEYSLPLQYVEYNGRICIWAGNAADKTWWRNFEAPAAVTVRLRGDDRPGKASLVDDVGQRTEILGAYVAQFPYTTPSGRPKFFGERWHPDLGELAEVAAGMVIVAIDLE